MPNLFHHAPAASAPSLPQRRTEDLILQQVGAELLLYDELDHRALCLNELTAAVWFACDGESSAAAIAERASEKLLLPVPQEAVLLTLQDLERDGLLQTATLPADIASLSRRSLVAKLGVGAVLMLPGIAMVMAPTAAQAYNGCFDCSASQARAAKRRKSADSSE